MRPLTLVESAGVMSLVGCVLAVAIPTFVRNLHASRLAEPIDGLSAIAAQATALADGVLEGRYPESVALTPADVPLGVAQLDPEEVWEHPTWKALGVAWQTPHRYSFQFSSVAAPGGASFEARAHGDLDGDGVWSTFSIRGEAPPGKRAVTFPMEIDREVE